MVPEVAQVLAKLLQREHFTGPDDYVFTGETGRYLDGSALRRRFKDALTRAKLKPLRLHDLRHSFGSLGARHVAALDLQTYLGHADARTTARYLHYRSRSGEAKRLADAFQVAQPKPAEVEELQP